MKLIRIYFVILLILTSAISFSQNRVNFKINSCYKTIQAYTSAVTDMPESYNIVSSISPDKNSIPAEE